MQAIIFYVEESVYKIDWAIFVREAAALKAPQSNRRLAPNVWLEAYAFASGEINIL
jgi:hypothetical protein